MKISIEKTVREDREIKFPFFKKKEGTVCREFVAGINENTIYTLTIFHDGPVFVALTNAPSSKTNVLAESLSWENIGEEKYLQVHAEALRSLSLEPVLVDSQYIGNDGETGSDNENDDLGSVFGPSK